jgi:uncharacterized protein YggE
VDADAPNDATIRLVGKGRASVKPDLATISIGVERKAVYASAARAAADQTTSSLVESMVAVGIDRADSEISSATLNKAAGQEGGWVEFVANRVVTVRSRRLDLLQRVVDVAVAAGVTTLTGPELELSDPSAGVEAATRDAVRDARSRANETASEWGARVTGVRSIHIDSDNQRRPSGHVDVSVTADVTFTISE